RALMLEAPERGVLARRRGGVGGVDLDDPAESVDLVLVARGAGVEALVHLFPATRGRGVLQAIAAIRRRDALGAEVAVEVLLPAEDRPPGRRPA
ncbi:hypothetical protein ABE10_01380, partial [Bacillus toyonensis]|nr:hypothetical protein [Bacillus toyonensis]